LKASELMRYENFGERLTATMREFFTLHFGGDWHATWNGTASPSGSQRWLVNSLINAVFVPGAQKQALEVVRREFGTSVVAWKRPLQKCYFRLATSRTGGLLAQASIAVHPPIPNAERWLIVTGTHKVRFIDSKAGISYCCLKAGSDAAHFQREVESRLFAEQHGVPVPHIVAHLSDSCLAESMVLGTPLNRLTSLREQRLGLQLALQAIEPLYNATARVVDLCESAHAVVSQVEDIARSSPQIASTQAVTLARRLGDVCDGSCTAVEFVRAHGDFQPGNILYDRGKIWLIDWEFSRDRSWSFDRLTYELRACFASGLAERIVLRAGTCTNSDERRELRLFVLETILFECEQAMVSPASIRRSLTAKLAEIEKALPVLLSEC
jgi:hypothetical protein